MGLMLDSMMQLRYITTRFIHLLGCIVELAISGVSLLISDHHQTS